jgi:DNA-binding NarL/FixJ family response regulator
MKKIKIVLADDHQIIRDGLKMVLTQDSSIEIIGEASNGKHLIELLDKIECDVLLLDISMPQVNGLQSLIQIKNKYPLVKILMLTMHEEPEYVKNAIMNGADGYLFKNSDYIEIILAIKTVYDGKKYFNPTVASLLVESLNQAREAEKMAIHLTMREKEILKMVASGLSNKLIADELEISPRTVETHRNNLIKKFDVYNTAELVKKASDHKYV